MTQHEYLFVAVSIILGASMTVLIVQAVVLSLAALFVITRPAPADDGCG